MAKAITIAVALLVAGCSSPEERRNGAIMHRLEQGVQLPKGARPLSAYARYYAFAPTGDVEALYLIPSLDEASPLKAGQRRWVVDSGHFPVATDGGCWVISLLFDAKTGEAKSVECNGRA
jgi:hypothetical protein